VLPAAGQHVSFMPRVALHTLGCKLNYAETSTIGRQFRERGYHVVPFGDDADVCVINTCTVTERADRECRQLIRRARRTSPRAFIVVTGCYAQLQPEAVASIAGVDLVLGSRDKFSVFEHGGAFVRGDVPRVVVSPVGEDAEFGPAASTAGDRTRAFLKVQDGCDYSCSYCTIPLARGGSRSLPVSACVDHAAGLVAQGYREIVLTGVNVGDYGRQEGTSLLTLLRALVAVPGLARLRISSIEPNLFDDEILALAADVPVLCPHFHIPLQSGDDRILRLMRRRYTAGDVAALLDRIHRKLPHAGVGMDVIVGFPGEEEAHFEVTHRFLADQAVSYLHVFTYSERPDTPAASLPGRVEPRHRFARNEALRALGQRKRESFGRAHLGSVRTVLTEQDVAGGRRLGFTDNYLRVALPADAAPGNALVPVRLLAYADGVCAGEPCDEGRGG
jgi:threonylcarbamoyladenosine tRNA methylthiotransferase MtaB